MKRTTIKLMSILLLITLMNQASGVASPVAFSVGDKFTFTLTKSSEYEKVNGTDYSGDSNYAGGDVLTYTVDKISTMEDSIFGVQTLVNVTEENGGKTSSTSVTVDSWRVMYLLSLIGLVLVGFGFPDNIGFSAPEENNDDTDYGLPIFVTNNETFYQDFSDKFTDNLPPIDEVSEGENVTSLDSSVDLDTDAKKFSLSLNTLHTIVGSSSSGDNARMEYSSSFNMVADYSKSIIDSLYFKMRIYYKVGDAEYDSFTEMEIKQGEIKLNSGIADLPTPLFATLLAVLTIVPISRKRR